MDKSRAQIKSLIREIIQHHRIFFGKHCREDSMPGRSVHSDDFMKVLNWGEIIEHKWDDKHQAYKCQITGEDIEGDKLTLIVSVSEIDFRIRCITVF